MTFTSTLYKTKNQTWYYGTLYSEQAGLPAVLASGIVPHYSDDKNSVDTGSFEPGVFRINPYTVFYELTDSEDSTVETVIDYSPWVYVRAYSGPIGPYLVSQTMFGRPLSGEFTDVGLRTLQRAMSKVGQSSLSLGVEFGEFKETIQMLRSPFLALRQFFFLRGSRNWRAFKELCALSPRGRKSATRLLRSTGKTAADTWLEIRYGLRPLISSIQAVVDEVNAKRAKFNSHVIRSVSAVQNKEVSDSSSGKVTVGGDLSFYRNVRTQSLMKVRAKVYYRQTLEQTTDVKWGISPRHLPEIAWELTRLSFVADWLVSVGPWLGSLRVQPEIEILGNTVSYRCDSVGVGELSTAPHPTFKTHATQYGEVPDVVFKREYYDRKVNVQPPSTPLFRYGDALSIPRAIDSLALLVQFIF
jgi:hypothetical protein